MRRLGFKHWGWDEDIWNEWYQRGRIDDVIEFARHFESFDDLPWNAIDLLETLDHEFPDSKFVLLERDRDTWLASLREHNRHQGQTLSTSTQVEELQLRNQQIKEHFSGDKAQQLLTMNVVVGDGYERLCPFLGMSVLSEEFPHANRTVAPPLRSSG